MFADNHFTMINLITALSTEGSRAKHPEHAESFLLAWAANVTEPAEA